MSLYATIEGKLIVGTHEIMLWIFNLIICVAIDIIGEESDALHIREQGYRIRQVLGFYRREE
jgi:hypothetical protein